jgi:hypothetical protein
MCLARSLIVIVDSFPDSAPIAKLIVREPELADTRFTRVGKLDELVSSTTLRRLYLKDVDRGPGPRQHGGVVIGTASSMSDDAIGNS